MAIMKIIPYIVPKPLIHPSGVEGVLGLGECEHRSFQWPRVSLVTRELSKYGFGLSGKGSSILPLKQTNIQNTQLG